MSPSRSEGGSEPCEEGAESLDPSAEGGDGGEAAEDTEQLRSQLAGMTAEMASQLSQITQEMNRLKAEISGDSGLGKMHAEIASIQSQLGGEQRLDPQRHPPDLRADEGSRRGNGLMISVVITVLVLGGPLWPLTSRVLDALSILALGFRRPTPWYDRDEL
ncbi:hypothetical protein T492DRAFT_1011620 [Pavlovales sp. CCMP2436]|nr:hypothetical protein T492DRAFT_1011620 [Pavlovales sp. CCMP2436]